MIRRWFKTTSIKDRSKTFNAFVKKGDIIQIFITNEMKIETESLSELKIKRAALSKKFQEFTTSVGSANASRSG